MPTLRQLELYDFIVAFISQHRTGPTQDECAAHLGVKYRASVNRMLKRLEEDGLIRRSRKARDIKIKRRV